MFQHGDPVRRGKSHRPTRSAFADDDRDHRHADLQRFGGGARDGFGLSALFGTLAGIGARRVDQRYQRQTEAVGDIHQTDRLAVALGPGHAEIALDPGFGVMALFMADHHHRRVVEPRQTAHHGMVVGKVAVAGQGGEFGKQSLDIVAAMRSVGMARHLAFAPGRQGLVQIAQHHIGLAVQRRRLFLDIHVLVATRHRPQLFRLALNLGKRLFEFKIVHGAGSCQATPISPCRGKSATRQDLRYQGQAGWVGEGGGCGQRH